MTAEGATADGRVLHTIPHAAEILDVSPRTVKRLILDGDLRAVHIRSSTRIPQWEIERYARAAWAAEHGLDPETLTPSPITRAKRRRAL